MTNPAMQWAMLDAIPGAAIVMDAEGTMVASNRAWTALYPHNYLANPKEPNYLELLRTLANNRQIPADDRLTLTSAVGQICDVLEGRSPEATIFVHWPSQGLGPTQDQGQGGYIHRHLEIHVAVHDALAVVCHRDLTPLYARIQNAEDAAYRYDRLIAGLPVGLYCKDSRGRYMAANRAFADTIGRDPEELVGLTDGDLFDRATANERDNEDQRILTTGRPEQREMTLDLHGRRLHVREDKRPLRDTDGSILGVIGLLTDISEQKTAEQNVAHARHHAEAGHRAKMTFLVNVGHEIRTPMNAIGGLIHVLEQTPLSPQQREVVSRLTSASQSLLAILNDVLDVSALEAGHLQLAPQPISLPQTITALIDALRPLAEEQGLILKAFLPADLPASVLADGMRLQQILINLLGNGIKFTPEGQVSLGIQVLSLAHDTALLRFQVQDTGIGISEEQKADLFQLFHQGDTSRTRRYGGVGLGLALSARLVAMMGGSITVTSQPNQGTAFDFTLSFPLCADPQAETEAEPMVEMTIAEHSNQQTLSTEEEEEEKKEESQKEEEEEEEEEDDAPLIVATPQSISSDPPAYEAHRPLSFRTATTKPELKDLAARSVASVDNQSFLKDNPSLSPPSAPRRAATPSLPEWAKALPMASLAGLDVVDALNRLDGDGELLLALLEQFEETQSDVVTRMAALAETGLLEKIAHLAHTLKGNAANLGAVSLARAAESIMRLARINDLEGTLGLLVPLRRQLALTLYAIDALRRHIQAHTPPPPPVVQTIGQANAESNQTTPEFRADFERLYRLLNENSMGAMDVYTSIRPGLVTLAGEPLTRDLGRTIQRLDYQKALKVMMEIALELGTP